MTIRELMIVLEVVLSDCLQAKVSSENKKLFIKFSSNEIYKLSLKSIDEQTYLKEYTLC